MPYMCVSEAACPPLDLDKDEKKLIHLVFKSWCIIIGTLFHIFLCALILILSHALVYITGVFLTKHVSQEDWSQRKSWLSNFEKCFSWHYHHHHHLSLLFQCRKNALPQSSPLISVDYPSHPSKTYCLIDLSIYNSLYALPSLTIPGLPFCYSKCTFIICSVYDLSYLCLFLFYQDVFNFGQLSTPWSFLSLDIILSIVFSFPF